MPTVGIGPLQDPVTWYGINYAGTRMTQWDFQNKGKSGWTGTSSFVLDVPLRHLRPSVMYSVPCDRILQRAYYTSTAIIDLSHIAVDSTLSLRKSNPIGVCEVLKGLKPDKATGCDLIPPRLVQQSAEVLTQPFSTLFNYILDHATVPSQWKLGEISPLHQGL